MTVDELIKAAYEIKEICQANGETCKGCPFSYVFYGATYCKFEDEEGAISRPWEWCLREQIECEEEDEDDDVQSGR